MAFMEKLRKHLKDHKPRTVPDMRSVILEKDIYDHTGRFLTEEEVNKRLSRGDKRKSPFIKRIKKHHLRRIHALSGSWIL